MNELQTQTLTQEQIDLIKTQIMPKDSTANELKLFAMVVNKTQLDPFSRQIYAIRRQDKMSYEVSIDGARLIAERTKLYAGQLGPWWCGEDGEWKDVWVDKKLPVAAKISVIRKDFQQPLTAVALFKEYAPNLESKQGFIWKKFPALMIAKVAEMLALRRAFPQELSGLYSGDEMSQAETKPQPQPVQEKPIKSLMSLETRISSLLEAFSKFKVNAKMIEKLINCGLNELKGDQKTLEIFATLQKVYSDIKQDYAHREKVFDVTLWDDREVIVLDQ